MLQLGFITPTGREWRYIAALTFGLFLIAFVASSAPATAQGRPIKITLVQSLDFGMVGATTVSGTVTIQPNGTKLVSAGILDLGGFPAQAVFLIQGEKFSTFTITLPTTGTVTIPGGPSAALSDFQSAPAISGVLDKSGQATVTVGATLNVTPDLWEGVYTDPFDIIVSYQ